MMTAQTQSTGFPGLVEAPIASAPYVPAGPAAGAGNDAPTYSIAAKLGAEFFGTFLLVFVGVGSAVLGSALGLGQLGVGLAFGFALIAGASAVGHISGGHFNPAVTLGMALAGRTPWRDVLPYWVTQVAGAIVATLALFVATPKSINIITGLSSGSREELFRGAANRFGTHGPSFDGSAQTLVNGFFAQNATAEQITEAAKSGQITLNDSINFPMSSAILVEIIATAFFVGVILAVTDKRVKNKFAPVVIGLTLAIALIVIMPITNGSVNPARSLAPAIFGGGWALSQVWVFIVAPLVGASLAALFYVGFASARPTPIPVGPDNFYFTEAAFPASEADTLVQEEVVVVEDIAIEDAAVENVAVEDVDSEQNALPDDEASSSIAADVTDAPEAPEVTEGNDKA